MADQRRILRRQRKRKRKTRRIIHPVSPISTRAAALSSVRGGGKGSGQVTRYFKRRFRRSQGSPPLRLAFWPKQESTFNGCSNWWRKSTPSWKGGERWTSTWSRIFTIWRGRFACWKRNRRLQKENELAVLDLMVERLEVVREWPTADRTVILPRDNRRWQPVLAYAYGRGGAVFPATAPVHRPPDSPRARRIWNGTSV